MRGQRLFSTLVFDVRPFLLLGPASLLFNNSFFLLLDFENFFFVVYALVLLSFFADSFASSFYSLRFFFPRTNSTLRTYESLLCLLRCVTKKKFFFFRESKGRIFFVFVRFLQERRIWWRYYYFCNELNSYLQDAQEIRTHKLWRQLFDIAIRGRGIFR